MHNWPGTGIKHDEETVHHWKPASKTSGLSKSETISVIKVAWPSKWPFVTRLLGLGHAVEIVQAAKYVLDRRDDDPEVEYWQYGLLTKDWETIRKRV